MKAIRVHEFGKPKVLRLEERPDLQPGRRQILIRVKAAGVNPVDTYIRAGTYAQKPKLPYTPGLDAAGVVEAVGEGIKGMSSGDRVYAAGTISGSYAEQALCKESQLHPLPSAVSYSQGAAIGVPYATAYRALLHCARAQRGESVLVHGASGGVGLAAVQLVHSLAMTVIGTAGSQEGLALVSQQGADHRTRPQSDWPSGRDYRLDKRTRRRRHTGDARPCQSASRPARSGRRGTPGSYRQPGQRGDRSSPTHAP